MNAVGVVLAAAVGLLLGALGGGGSILMVPLLVYVMGVPTREAVVISLPVVGLTSVAAAVGHWRAGHVQVRAAALFGVLAMLGAFLGGRVALLVGDGVQLPLLAFVMVGAGLSMLMTRSEQTNPERVQVPRGATAAAAIGIGALTGLVGVGGGFLFVPALVLLAHVPMHAAVGTSLVLIAMNAVAALAAYWSAVPLPWGFVLGFAGIASVGAVVGVGVARRLPASRLRRGFGFLLLGVAAFVLIDLLV